METEKRNQIITRLYNISRALILIIFLGSLLLWAATAEAATPKESEQSKLVAELMLHF